jgi:hypothetical protein
MISNIHSGPPLLRFGLLLSEVWGASRFAQGGMLCWSGIQIFVRAARPNPASANDVDTLAPKNNLRAWQNYRVCGGTFDGSVHPQSMVKVFGYLPVLWYTNSELHLLALSISENGTALASENFPAVHLVCHVCVIVGCCRGARHVAGTITPNKARARRGLLTKGHMSEMCWRWR